MKPAAKPEDNTSQSLNDRIVLVEAQEADEALQPVRKWFREGHVLKNNEMHGFPRLGWQLHNQLHSWYLRDSVLWRKFEILDGSLPHLQHIIPRSSVPDSSLHSSTTVGHLSTHKVINKLRQPY